MKLSVSNIAWSADQDETMYDLLKSCGLEGLEIAPTRIFPSAPYERIREGAVWSRRLKEQHGLVVSSMQSIWYGRSEQLFGTKEERQALLDYTRKAIDFAASVHCGNLVFGCPKNRCLPKVAEAVLQEHCGDLERSAAGERMNPAADRQEEWMETAVRFFRELGDYAAQCGTVLSMEANPAMYGTNFINTTKEALDLVEQVHSEGFLLNLDVGTMIANGEGVSVFRGKEALIHHVHISEPGLLPIEHRPLHKELLELLTGSGYENFGSIEMGRAKDGSLDAVEDAVQYVKSVFTSDTQ